MIPRYRQFFIGNIVMNSSISCLYLVYPGEHLKQSILTIVRKFC